jgi:hypothetical protein
MSTSVREDLPIQLTTRHLDLSAGINVGSDNLTLSNGTFAAPATKLASPTVNNNTKTCDMRFRDVLCARHVEAATIDLTAPVPEVAANANVSVIVRARSTGTPTTSKTLDLVAFRSNREGSVDTSIGTSGDVCTTAAQTVTTSWADYTFTLDGTGLLAGDPMEYCFRTFQNDTGGTGGGEIEIGDIKITEYERG